MGQEFSCIEKFLKPLSGTGAHGLLDDTATLSASDNSEFAVSTDTLIEGVHFIGTESPESLAIKLLSVNLSDLASVGARPVHYTLNISLPRNTPSDWWASFVKGLSHMQKTHNITVLGGDTTTGTSQVVLSATVFGIAIENPPLRCNAVVGDVVCMVGTVGAGAFGLLSAQGKINDDALLTHYQMPVPQITQGKILAPMVNAMADVSDGLVADCFNMAVASGVGMILQADNIKINLDAKKHFLNTDFADIYNTDTGNSSLTLSNKTVTNGFIECITGGDDYILVCTMGKEQYEQAKNKVTELHIIGTVTEKNGCSVLDSNGQILNLKGKYGYEHS